VPFPTAASAQRLPLEDTFFTFLDGNRTHFPCVGECVYRSRNIHNTIGDSATLDATAAKEQVVMTKQFGKSAFRRMHLSQCVGSVCTHFDGPISIELGCISS
jgi:hypothetical protein